jgi:hypothetical protein
VRGIMIIRGGKMNRRDNLKKINNIAGMATSIGLLCMSLLYFFWNKEIFRRNGMLMVFTLMGISSTSRIINARYFQRDFTWQKNSADGCIVLMALSFILVEVMFFRR